MRDSLLLVAAATLFAAIGWAIWHYLQHDAPWAISTVVLVAVAADNARLRRQLRSKGGQDD